MKAVCVIAVALLSMSCARQVPPTGQTATLATAQTYIAAWRNAGMWLPDSQQVVFFRNNFREVQPLLEQALLDKDSAIRQRAAFIAEEVGIAAAPLVPMLIAALKAEPDRTGRMYLYGALGATAAGNAEVIRILRERYASLDGKNVAGGFADGYAAVDEKIRVAAALCRVDPSNSQQELDFVLDWLRVPNGQLSDSDRAGLWERRWHAVLALKGLENAATAKPLLQALAAEPDAPSWVSVHVPAVLQSLP